MNFDIGFPLVIIAVLIGFGALINSDINQTNAKRDCRIELIKQTKLDTANVYYICGGK
jgi:hypothetical protein